MADLPPCDDVCGALEEHVWRFFAGRSVEAFTWTAGPILSQNPHFRVLRLAPASPSDVWTYVTVGGWAATESEDTGLEFILCTAEENPRAVELLAMTVFYNRDDKLDLGHTLPIGESWLPGSTCNHLLVSLPYPFGQELEIAHVGDRHVEFAWLLPITDAERAFKVDGGVEALESIFDQVGLRFWQVDRDSAV